MVIIIRIINGNKTRGLNSQSRIRQFASDWWFESVKKKNERLGFRHMVESCMLITVAKFYFFFKAIWLTCWSCFVPGIGTGKRFVVRRWQENSSVTTAIAPILLHDSVCRLRSSPEITSVTWNRETRCAWCPAARFQEPRALHRREVNVYLRRPACLWWCLWQIYKQQQTMTHT